MFILIALIGSGIVTAIVIKLTRWETVGWKQAILKIFAFWLVMLGGLFLTVLAEIRWGLK